MITVGIDEVGRGCWAGPLVAAAVILPPQFHQDGPGELRDSKKLSKNKREFLAGHIKSQAVAYGVGWVTPGEVDELGLTKSVRLAMLRAMKMLHQTTLQYDKIIIDGNVNFFANVEGLSTDRISAVVRADDTVPAVSAASILAKVARDDYMAQMSLEYPGYGFDKHVGYGTAEHLAALKQHGVTELHRKSYKPIQKFL